jgi:hypothetical protein
MRSKFLWAALALVAVLGITTAASATTRGLITGKQIAPHSINSKHLVNHTIQKHDLSPGLIKSLHGARGATGRTGPMGPQGPIGPQGPVGPQGPAWSRDSTVRHISGAMDLGKTVSTPIMSAEGQLGTLTLGCTWDNGGKGTITYTTDKGSRFILYSPDIHPGQRIWTLSEYGQPNTVTIPWSGTAMNDIWFDAMIEYQQPAPQRPGLTMLHGYVAAFNNIVVDDQGQVWSGCVYYLMAENSEVASPTS